MDFSKFLAVALVLVSAMSSVSAQGREGVLARCGASKGNGYFFKTASSDAEWSEDGISKGKIVLVSLGDEWDIQFDDINGAYGYREDGASVVPLGQANGKMTVIAFHPNYTDVYTFNFVEHEVVWTSHKIGTPITKVAIYRAECEG